MAYLLSSCGRKPASSGVAGTSRKQMLRPWLFLLFLAFACVLKIAAAPVRGLATTSRIAHASDGSVILPAAPVGFRHGEDSARDTTTAEISPQGQTGRAEAALALALHATKHAQPTKGEGRAGRHWTDFHHSAISARKLRAQGGTTRKSSSPGYERRLQAATREQHLSRSRASPLQYLLPQLSLRSFTQESSLSVKETSLQSAALTATTNNETGAKVEADAATHQETAKVADSMPHQSRFLPAVASEESKEEHSQCGEEHVRRASDTCKRQLSEDWPTITGPGEESYCKDKIITFQESGSYTDCTVRWSCVSNCTQKMQLYLQELKDYKVRFFGETMYEAGETFRQSDPSAEKFTAPLVARFSCCGKSGEVRYPLVSTLEPMMPELTFANGLEYSVDASDAEFTVEYTVKTCLQFPITLVWSYTSPNDMQDIKGFLSAAHDAPSGTVTLTLLPRKMVAGSEYSISCGVSYEDHPDVQASATVVLTLSGTLPPAAILEIHDSTIAPIDTELSEAFVKAASRGQYLVHDSRCKANTDDPKLKATWSCEDPCNKNIKDFLQDVQDLTVTLPESVVHAAAVAEMANEPTANSFWLKTTLVVANAAGLEDTASHTTLIHLQVDPPSLASLTQTNWQIYRSNGLNLGVGVVTACPLKTLELNWMVSSTDTRPVDALLSLSADNRTATISPYTLLQQCTYKFAAIVSYAGDTGSRTKVVYSVEVLQSAEKPPVIVLQAPDNVHMCEPLTADLSGSTSFVDNSGLSASWRCTGCPNKLAESFAQHTGLLADFPQEIVLSALQEELQAQPHLQEKRATLTAEVTDANLNSARASHDITFFYSLGAPRVNAVEGASQRIEHGAVVTLRAEVDHCSHANGALGHAWTVESPWGVPVVSEALEEDAGDWKTATVNSSPLLKGQTFLFRLRVWYDNQDKRYGEATFSVEVQSTEEPAPNAVIESVPPKSTIGACESIQFHFRDHSETPDPNVQAWWMCYGNFCPQIFREAAERSKNKALTVTEEMAYKMTEAFRSEDPAASDATFPVGVRLVLVNAQQVGSLAEHVLNIERLTARPGLVALPPLSYSVRKADAVQMRVQDAHCTAAHDFVVDWRLSSDFDRRPATDILKLSSQDLVASIDGDTLVEGAQYTVEPLAYYAHDPTRFSSVIFDITVARAVSPPAPPTAVLEGPQDLQGACDSFELSGQKSEARTDDGVLIGSWECLGVCPNAFVNALRGVKSLSVTIDASVAYEGMREHSARNPSAATFTVEFQLTVRDSYSNTAQATARVQIRNKLTNPQLVAVSNTSLYTKAEDPVTLQMSATSCPHVATAESSGIVITWKSRSLDARPFEEIFTLSKDRLTATAPSHSLRPGVSYVIDVQLAYEEDETLNASVTADITVQSATFALSFNLEEIRID